MEEFTTIVSSLGFPIAVALFALWNSREHEKYLQNVLDTTLKENTNAIDRLGDLLDGALLFMKDTHASMMKGGNDNEDK